MEHDQQQMSEQQKIQALLARMDEEDRQTAGRTLDQGRLDWQHKPYLRYVIGPFMAGVLFDAAQWVVAQVDRYLWGWASEALPDRQQAAAAPGGGDPRAALRQALAKKTTTPNPPPGDSPAGT